MPDGTPRPRILIVIPCLNEAGHIGDLLAQLTPTTERLGAEIVVADGGSVDGTQEIVAAAAALSPRVHLVHNEKRLQSAAINMAVERFGEAMDYLIRIDAHGGYPANYCDRVIADAVKTGADSVVVSMVTLGSGLIQGATAKVQNSILGTGGSRHRHRSSGEWVDHGHHALMRISAFKQVGGYDETFSHNEDAELDHRLRAAGCRIWLSGRTHMVYFPRSSIQSLYRQYFGYGKGRAKNAFKHRTVPKPRQMAPLLVAPAVLLAVGTFMQWLPALPFLVWMAFCIGYGFLIAARERDPALVLTGLVAMVMHMAWSLGFWWETLTAFSKRVTT